MPQVHCTVNTCRYYQKGHLCSASEIVVQTDREGKHSRMGDVTSMSATPAYSTGETCCQTFEKA